MKNNLGRKLFQSNNILDKFKPKKKSRTIILQEELKKKQFFCYQILLIQSPTMKI